MPQAARLFMKLTGATSGEIKGDSQAEGYENQVAIESWNWSLSRSSESKSGLDGAGTPGVAMPQTVEPSVLSFTKEMDRSTTALLSCMRSGEMLTAVMTLEEASDVDFELVVTLEKVRVIEYKLDAKNEDKGGTIDEDWVFNYETVVLDYRATGGQGRMTYRGTRHPGASTDAPDSSSVVEKKVIELTKDLGPSDLNALWEKIKPQGGSGAKNSKDKT